MKRSFVLILLGVFTISGCSGTSSNLALGKFDYIDKTEGKPLVIPDNLTKPNKNTKFTIKPLAVKGDYGKDIDVRSPSLVLPIATASRLEKNSSKAYVWFDQVIDDEELYPFILSSVKEMLDDKGVSLLAVNEQDKHFQSSWLIKEDVYDYVLYSKLVGVENSKFDFYFDVKPHGRSVGVQVVASGFMKTFKDIGSTSERGYIEQQRAEMQVLNSIIEKVDFRYRSYQNVSRNERENQQVVSIGKNAKREATYIVEMELDTLWSLIPEFFDEHGFNVIDLNQPTKEYYLDYERPSNSIWSYLGISQKVPVIKLEKGKYQFKLRESSNNSTRTDVTIYDAEGNALSKEVLESIFPVIEEGLSFKDLF